MPSPLRCCCRPLPTPRRKTFPAQTGATSAEIAKRTVEALDSGNWDLVAKDIGTSPEQVKTTWTNWESVRGSGPAWAGPARVEPKHDKDGQPIYDLVVFPILRTNGHILIKLEVAQGKVRYVGLAPDPASYGPYAALTNKCHVWPGGSRSIWYVSPSGGAVVYEVRGPTGALAGMQVIKPAGGGSLILLRSTDCPDGVCGQAGTVQDGVVHWREPKYSGGYSGEYMDVKMWMEGNALVTFTTNPSPNGGVQIYDQYPELEYLRPKPFRMELVKTPPHTPEQKAESRAKVAALEPLVELEVAKALGKQASIGQGFANTRAERQRSSEKVRSFNRAMQGINGVLNDAVAEVGTYEEAQGNLNATVANIQAQAAAERLAQVPAQQQAPTRAVDYQTQVAEPVTQPQPPPQSQSRESDTAAVKPAASAAAKPLRFVMSISLRNQPGDKVNPTCYSNIVSRPGPPGWGAPGFLPPGSGEQARETVYGLKSAFIARCRASGREITSEGNFNFQLNQMRGDEERLQEMRARYSEDVSVSL